MKLNRYCWTSVECSRGRRDVLSAPLLFEPSGRGFRGPRNAGLRSGTTARSPPSRGSNSSARPARSGNRATPAAPTGTRHLPAQVELMGGDLGRLRVPTAILFSFTIPLATGEAGDPPAGASPPREARGPLLLLHRMAVGPIPGETELSSWGYRTAVTTVGGELQRTLEDGEPFACVVSTGTEISSALGQIAGSASLAGDRVPWFLFARPEEGGSVPQVNRPVGEVPTAAVVRLIRASTSIRRGGGSCSSIRRTRRGPSGRRKRLTKGDCASFPRLRVRSHTCREWRTSLFCSST
jgi:hypothetical protein